MLYQYLIRKDKNITHAVWVVPSEIPNMFRIASNLPIPYIIQFLESKKVHNLFTREDSHSQLTQFIRFLDGKDLDKFSYPNWFPKDFRTNAKAVQRLRDIWWEIPQFVVASPKENPVEFWFIKTELEAMFDFYPEVILNEIEKIDKDSFESQLQSFEQIQNYVEYYYSIDSYYTFKEECFDLYLGCKGTTPLVALLNRGSK